MNKQYQKIKIVAIFLILFCSCFIVINPIGKSAPIDKIYECTPLLIVEYDKSILENPIIPFDDPTIIPVTVKAKIIGPADDIIEEFIGGGGVNLIVDLSIAKVPDGCHASLTPTIVQFPVSKEYETTNATLKLTINQYLPVKAQKNVVIQMNSRRLGRGSTLVHKGNISQEVPFEVGYYPQLSFAYVDGNVRDIEPDKTAGFTFEIKNWGNGVTDVISEVSNLPDGWTAEIVRNTILGTEFGGDNSKKTISFKVKPPIDFGYHEDRAIIKVSMTPYSRANPEDKGEPHYLYFIVQSKGFSTPGFETIFLLFAIIIVFLPAIIKKKRKNEKKQKVGKSK
jgi:hypothetical protein